MSEKVKESKIRAFLEEVEKSFVCIDRSEGPKGQDKIPSMPLASPIHLAIVSFLASKVLLVLEK